MGNYLGWSNRDTWLCLTWILDFDFNYKVLTGLTSDQITKITTDDIQYLFYFGDRVKFDQLNLDELREAFHEHTTHVVKKAVKQGLTANKSDQ